MGEHDPFDLVGNILADKYAIEEIVAEGGYSIVYRATHLMWKRPVAIKAFKLGDVPTSTRDALVEAFVREGALLAQLSERSASICQARDVATMTTPSGEWVPYLVLEWLEGESLEAWVTRERAKGRATLTLDEAMGLLRPAAEGLALAHREGVTHCDVKPGNFFVVGTHGRPRTTKLVDFGIARVLRGARPTDAAPLNGAYTPGYGAPEQFRPELGSIGPWTDVFALALILVEMVSGRDALAGGDLQTLAGIACARDRRPTPRALGVLVSDEVEAVFSRALAVRPRDRYETAGQFLIALDGAMRAEQKRRSSVTPLVLAPREEPLPRLPPPSITRRLAARRRSTVGSVVGTIGIVVGVAGMALAARAPASAGEARVWGGARSIAAALTHRAPVSATVGVSIDSLRDVDGGPRDATVEAAP